MSHDQNKKQNREKKTSLIAAITVFILGLIGILGWLSLRKREDREANRA